MIDTPFITNSSVQQTAVVHLTVPRAEIQHVMGPAITEVMSALAEQGVEPAGPLFSYHLRMEPDLFDFEVGVPVKTPITPTGRVKAGQLPGVKVARTVYRGPYETLGQAWGEFGEWMKANGHAAADNLWECYVVGPEVGPDVSRWETQLNRPIMA
ncbi:MAG TPA: GyrI-like domain-containing protein [Gemmatimonadaceae bacterium]